MYPFVAHNLFPRIAQATLEQPKNKGGVSLLNVEIQQKGFLVSTDQFTLVKLPSTDIGLPVQDVDICNLHLVFLHISSL